MYKAWGFTFSKWSSLLFAGDLLLFSLSIPFGLWLGAQLGERGWWLRGELLTLAGLGTVYLTVLYIGELYNFYLDFRRRENLGQVILWALAGSLVALVIFCYPTPKLLPRRFLEWQALAFVWLLVLWRYSFSALALPNRLKRRLLIVGAGTAGRRLLEALERRPNSGFEAVGFVDDDPAKMGLSINGLKVLGNSTSLEALLKQYKVKLVVMAITHDKSPALLNTLTRLYLNGTTVLDMPSFYEFLAQKIPIDHISDTWLFLNSLKGKKIFYRHFKRVFDIIMAVAGLIVCLPLFPIIALAIKMDSEGPVFFCQDRLGKDGNPFTIIKFRTMVKDAECQGPCWATSTDPRITRVGKFLRKTRLDEIPQLINILRGDMSFIGPRPEREVFIQQFQEPVPEYRPGRRTTDPPGTQVLCGFKERIPYYSYRLIVRPGVTGWAQVMYSYASSLDETKEKLQYDLYYIKNMSFLLDLLILLKTIRIILLGKGK